MIIKNTETGQDVTEYCLQYLQNEITKEKFEELTGLDARNMRIDYKK